MILPFMSFSWLNYSGKYGMSAVKFFSNVPNAAKGAAVQLRNRSKGRRVAIFQGAENNGLLFTHPGDRLNGQYRGLWFDAGIASTFADFTVVVDQLWGNKGDLDYAVFDIESGVSPYVLGAADLVAIYADPRYPALVASGRFPADCRNMNAAQIAWFNSGCAYLGSQAVYKALILPLYNRFNNVNWSNYGDAPLTKADAAFAFDFNDNMLYYEPSPAPVYAPINYGYVGTLGSHDPRFNQPYYMTLWQSNTLRATARAANNAKLTPWVAPRVSSNVLDNTWWAENIIHACCLAGPNLLYFNADDSSPVANWRMDTVLGQFVGQSRGKVWSAPLTTDLIRYDTAKFIHSACKLEDGSFVGRVTFKPGINSATFAVQGKNFTIARPEGAVGAWFHS